MKARVKRSLDDPTAALPLQVLLLGNQSRSARRWGVPWQEAHAAPQVGESGARWRDDRRFDIVAAGDGLPRFALQPERAGASRRGGWRKDAARGDQGKQDHPQGHRGEKQRGRLRNSGGLPGLRCADEDHAECERHKNACPAKHLKKFERFVGRAALDIEGISSATLKDFINAHFISDFADIFHLADHADAIRLMEGYGDRSCENLLAAVEKSRDADPVRVIVAMSIPLIGTDAAQRIVRSLGWQGFLQRLEEGTGFADLDGFGAERSNSVLAWYADEAGRESFQRVLRELRVRDVQPEAAPEGTCSGLTFVITGDVHVFKNRDAFKAYVQAQGGKVAGSVSKKTSFLVNNDALSASSKNAKARELGIPVITEDAFIARFGR